MGTKLRISLLAATLLSIGTPSQAQNFGNAYFFGDSLTDCCFDGRFTNGDQPNWADQLPPQIGASFIPSTTTNLAIGGAQSGDHNAIAATDAAYGIDTGFLGQVGRFAVQGQTITSRDIAGIWIGTNDIWPSAMPAGAPANQPIGARPGVATFADYVTGNVRSGIDTLTSLGVRNVVLVSPYDLSKSTVFGVFGGADATTLDLAHQYSVAVRDGLARLYTPGVNTYFLDTLTLLDRVQANPALYGFDHVTAADSCSAAGCTALPLEQQNRYVFNDVIHTTSGFDQLMVDYIANMINAREALPALGDLGEGSARVFSNSLFARLDAYRQSGAEDAPGSVAIGNGASLFAELTYGGFDVDSSSSPTGPGGAGFDADLTGVTAGLQYRALPNLLVGWAFNYQSSDADVGQFSRTEVELDTVQGAMFASYSSPNLFADGILAYASHSFDTDRPGVVDRLNASTDGRTFTAAGKVGYLFHFSGWQAGPIAQLSYANMHIDGYQESGDSLLTLGVRDQDYDSLTGSAGVQLRTTIAMPGAVVSPFLNLTAEHDFLDGVRTITSFGTISPALLINTSGGHEGDDLYGKVAGGFRIDLGGGLEGIVAGSSTFGRSYGDDFSINAGLGYRF